MRGLKIRSSDGNELREHIVITIPKSGECIEFEGKSYIVKSSFYDSDNNNVHILLKNVNDKED